MPRACVKVADKLFSSLVQLLGLCPQSTASCFSLDPPGFFKHTNNTAYNPLCLSYTQPKISFLRSYVLALTQFPQDLIQQINKGLY